MIRIPVYKTNPKKKTRRWWRREVKKNRKQRFHEEINNRRLSDLFEPLTFIDQHKILKNAEAAVDYNLIEMDGIVQSFEFYKIHRVIQEAIILAKKFNDTICI